MNKFNRIAILVTVVLVVAFAITLQSYGQGKEAPPSTNRPADPAANKSDKPAPAEDFSKNTWSIPADADKTINPTPTSEESVARGKELYMNRKGNCVFCHGETGAGNEENMPKLRRKPADISNKERMAKMSDGELFWKISLGIQGIMPGREKQMTPEERWDVVNYIRTLGKSAPMN